MSKLKEKIPQKTKQKHLRREVRKDEKCLIWIFSYFITGWQIGNSISVLYLCIVLKGR